MQRKERDGEKLMLELSIKYKENIKQKNIEEDIK